MSSTSHLRDLVVGIITCDHSFIEARDQRFIRRTAMFTYDQALVVRYHTADLRAVARRDALARRAYRARVRRTRTA
jgi:hypothetical protein